MNENLQTVFDKVKGLLNDATLDELVKSVLLRLVSFGHAPTENDVFPIAYGAQKVRNNILNQINQKCIPDGLFEVAVDMVCGEVLNGLYLCGTLDMSGLDFSGIVNSVTEGDTSVSFGANGQDDEKIIRLISWLSSGKGCDLLCYRKMRW